MAERHRAVGVSALSRIHVDRARPGRDRAFLGGSRAPRRTAAAPVAHLSRARCPLRGDRGNARLVRAMESGSVWNPPAVGRDAAEAIVDRLALHRDRARPAPVDSGGLEPAIPAGLLHDCRGRHVALQSRTVANPAEPAAALQSAVLLAHARAGRRRHPRTGSLLGAVDDVSRDCRRAGLAAHRDEVAVAALIAAGVAGRTDAGRVLAPARRLPPAAGLAAGA